MNPQSDQIRALIDEIDELLHGGSNSFLWRFSGDRARHQDALQRLRRYLSTMQTTLRIRNLPGGDVFDEFEGLSRPPVFRQIDPANPFAIEEDEIEDREDIDEIGLENAVPETLVHRTEISDHTTELEVRPLGYRDSEALLGQLSLELAQLRESLVAPLQTEIQQLHQQRSLLQSEVTQLEIRRAQYHQSPEQDARLHQFIETLMGRLQERMVKQVATILQQALPQIVASQMAALPPAEAQQVQQLQKRANALLSNMDSTIRVFSQTLEQNVQAYQQSLSVGLERMHNMGRQGETLVSGLVNRLAEQMEQQTALYLQAPVQLGASVTPGSTVSDGSASENNSFAPESEAIQRARWEANARVSSTWQSTSSAGILPDALGQRQTAMAAPAQPIQDLDAFYAGLDAAPVDAPATRNLVSAAVSAEPQAIETQPKSGHPGKLGVAHRPNPSLEEALFEGIPDGELWTSPWENLPTAPAILAPDAQPDPAQTIHSLEDLVNRTFQDLENLNLQTTDAVMAPPSVTSKSPVETLEIKKKNSAPRSRTQLLTLPQRPPLATAS